MPGTPSNTRRTSTRATERVARGQGNSRKAQGKVWVCPPAYIDTSRSTCVRHPTASNLYFCSECANKTLDVYRTPN